MSQVKVKSSQIFFMGIMAIFAQVLKISADSGSLAVFANSAESQISAAFDHRSGPVVGASVSSNGELDLTALMQLRDR